MKGRAVLVGIMGLAALANVVLVVDGLTTNMLLPAAFASSGSSTAQPAVTLPERVPPEKRGPEAGAKEAETAFRSLVSQLGEQKQLLEKKAQELAERERQLNVLRQELAQEKSQIQEKAAASAQASGKKKIDKEGPSDSFKKLVKTYNGMEAETAALALVELLKRDRDTAIDLLIALQNRKAAQILDAVAATKPGVAAELSFEISHRDEPRAE